MKVVGKLNTDGGSRGNPGPAGIGFTLSVDGEMICRGGSYIGETSNNVAEYTALVWGLENAKAAGVEKLTVEADSELMVNQVNGTYRVKNEGLKPLYAQVKALIGSFAEFSIQHVYRDKNSDADAMANQALDTRATVGEYLRKPTLKQSLFDLASAPAITNPEPEIPIKVNEELPAVSTPVTHGDATPQDVAQDTLAADKGREGTASTKVPDIAEKVPQTATQTQMSLPELDAQPQKTVLVGVTGCIAAYKACEIVRGLQKAGLRVKVVMTQNATCFVGTTTFKALTREPVAVSLFDAPTDPIYHISLAKEADLFLIAPATANVMAKLAAGVADDLLTTTALATHAPLVIAPAMNTEMWNNPRTQGNVAALKAGGADIIEPASGMLACGDEGAGKLADVERIVQHVCQRLTAGSDLAGKQVLITAGPTYEAIDPVRFIGNRSSGKSGYALARAAQQRGAEVTLVSGPVALADPYGVQCVRVESAEQMLTVCEDAFEACDIAIFTAAVADFKPQQMEDQKIKKEGRPSLALGLVANPDIFKTLAAYKSDRFVVGYAAETQDVLQAAKGKLAAKNADLIVANDVSSPELGFGTDNNKVWLVSKDDVTELETMNKDALAHRILDEVVKRS